MVNKTKPTYDQLWFRAVLFAVAYFTVALLSQLVSFPAASFPSLWLPSGLFVAVLLRSEMSAWPVYMLSALVASLSYSMASGQPLAGSVLLCVSGALEAVAGASLVRRFDKQAGEFKTPANVLNLIVFSALISSALSATINTTVLATVDRGIAYGATWRVGWISHGLGILIIAPLVLAWADVKYQTIRRPDPERLIELAVLTSGLFVCSLYIFVGSFSMNKQGYMVVPFLVWMALRFGPRGVTISGLIVTLVSAYGTIQQLGSFVVSDTIVAINMDTLGSFLAIILITCHILATVWDQSKQVGKALRESEEHYRMLVENQGEGVAIVDPNEKFVFANSAALQIFGVDQLVGHSLRDFTDMQQFNMIRQQTRMRQAGKQTTYEITIIQPGGKRRILLITATPEMDGKNKFNGTFAVFHDVTERNQSEMALRDSRARFQTLFDHSPIPIFEVDFSRVKRLLDGFHRAGVEDFHEFFQQNAEQVDACVQLIRVLDINQAAVQLFNYKDKTLLMTQVNRVMVRGPRDVLIAELVAIGDGKTEFEMEGPNDILDGQVRHHSVRWMVAPGYEQDYRRVIMTIIDMTEREQAEERMRYLSTHDVLTGLYNRNFFETELERLQDSRMEPVNVMVIDVNGMKSTNDTFGHAAGDELLRRTAQVLRMSFRKEEIIARIGGDEFVVLFHGSISIQDSVDRVNGCLADHNHWSEGPTLSLAIGAASGGKGSSLVDLFKKADQQMYKEKLHSRKVRSETRINNKTGNSPQNY